MWSSRRRSIRLRAGELDPPANAQWVDGVEQAFGPANEPGAAGGPQAVFWTREAPPAEAFRGVHFGEQARADFDAYVASGEAVEPAPGREIFVNCKA